MNVLQDANHFVISGSTFTDNSQSHNHYGTRSGLLFDPAKIVLEATQDFSDIPFCLEGTRNKHIEEVVSWAQCGEGGDRPPTSVLWLWGPAGVGKTAIARTCAETLSSQVAATYFFSRSNRGSSPDRFFTTIAHQLAQRFAPYKEHLRAKLEENPTIDFPKLETQFRGLIETPFKKLREQADVILEAEPNIIIVDGLDECDSEEAQALIIRLAVNSAPALPFRWVIISRPEPHIESTFESLNSMEWQEIPLQDADDDIELYLRDGFQKILSKNRTTSLNWPSDEEISQLVRKSAGLFIYAATVLKFFANLNLTNPEQELRELLSLRSRRSTQVKPLANLHAFYALIMNRFEGPEGTLEKILTLLLVAETKGPKDALHKRSLFELSNLLGLSQIFVTASLNRLRSVISLKDCETYSAGGNNSLIAYHHASFLEFLKNPESSGDLCIYRPQHFRLWAERCVQVIEESSPGRTIELFHWNPQADTAEAETEAKAEAEVLRSTLCRYAIADLPHACAEADLPNAPDSAELFERLTAADYRSALTRSIDYKLPKVLILADIVLAFVDKIPGNFNKKIVRPNNPLGKRLATTLNPLHHIQRFDLHFTAKLFKEEPPLKIFDVYTLGEGDKSIFLAPHHDGLYNLGLVKISYAALLPSKALLKKSFDTVVL